MMKNEYENKGIPGISLYTRLSLQKSIRAILEQYH